MNQLEKTYAIFIESICKMYNVPYAAEPLVKGYEALLEAQHDNSPLYEGIGFDSIKRAGRNVIDFTKGFIHGIAPAAVCLLLPWIPINAIDYGKKLYKQHETDVEYAQKLSELNKALNYMNTIEIKIPKDIAREAETYNTTIFDALQDAVYSWGECPLLDDGPHKEACRTAKYIQSANRKLSDDSKQALLTITKCMENADKDKSYECKQETLNEIDAAIENINYDNKVLHGLLVSYSNEWSEAAKINAQRGLSSDAASDMVNAKMTDIRSDIPEWKKDFKANCDTISYGPGHWNRVENCMDNLWK